MVENHQVENESDKPEFGKATQKRIVVAIGKIRNVKTLNRVKILMPLLTPIAITNPEDWVCHTHIYIDQNINLPVIDGILPSTEESFVCPEAEMSASAAQETHQDHA
jgi:hypothetical protein